MDQPANTLNTPVSANGLRYPGPAASPPPDRTLPNQGYGPMGAPNRPASTRASTRSAVEGTYGCRSLDFAFCASSMASVRESCAQAGWAHRKKMAPTARAAVLYRIIETSAKRVECVERAGSIARACLGSG